MPRFHSRDLRKGRVSLEHQTYLITAVTYCRRPVFLNFHCARLLTAVLTGETVDACTLAYVIMPDHLHWLVQLRTEDTLDRLMQRIKGRSARRINLYLGTSGPIWQPGYHDHAVRCDEDLRNVARYVVANPLRAGLVSSLRAYPHWDAIWL